MSEPSRLAMAKIKVMERVPYIQKERKQGLTYSFAGEAAIIEKLHPAFIDAGLTWATTGCTLIAQESYTTKSGAGMNRVIVQATFTLTHAESGQSETIQTLGEGSDHGDKATSKALTSALKYALRQAFLIETGDDPDHTPSDQQERGQQRPAHQHHQQQPAKAAPLTPHALWERMGTKTPRNGRELVEWLTPLDAALVKMTAAYRGGSVFANVRGLLRLDEKADLSGIPERDVAPAWANARNTVKLAADQSTAPAGAK